MRDMSRSGVQSSLVVSVRIDMSSLVDEATEKAGPAITWQSRDDQWRG